MAFRYHTMLPLRNNLPDFIHSKAEADKFLKAYIPAIVKRYKDKTFAFDVVGELIDKTEWRNSAFSNFDLICNAFKYARDAAGPHIGLFYNDFGHSSMASGFWQKGKSDVVFDLVKKLRDNHCGIDGVGFSGHWVLDDETDHVL
jgi:GH35 family endo-1,4-beta-xylanase